MTLFDCGQRRGKTYRDSKTKHTVAQQAVDAAASSKKTLAQSLAETAKRFAESERIYRRDRTSASHAAAQIGRLERAVALGELLAKQRTLTNEAAALAERLRQAKAIAEQRQPEIKRLTRELADAAMALAQSQTQKPADAANAESLPNTITQLSISITQAQQALDSANADSTAISSLRDQKLAEVNSLIGPLTARRAELAETWAQQFSVAVVQPLTPEQLALSILRATGQTERQRASAAAAIN